MKGMSFDTGKHCAWTAGRLDMPGARVELLGCGELDRGFDQGRDDRVAEALDLLVRFEPDIVFVETVFDVFEREGLTANMAGHLVRAARLGGRIYQLAEDHGFRAEEIAAETWRLRIVGKRSPENREITPVVKLRFLNWPKSSNNHERDAGGLLAYGLDKALREQLVLPMVRAVEARAKRSSKP